MMSDERREARNLRRVALAKPGERTCKEPGCERVHNARGLCYMHYFREYRKRRKQK